MGKQYLGDGAYFEYDGYNVVLTAENGICATDTVCLEPEVLNRFLNCLLELPKGHPVADNLRQIKDDSLKLSYLEAGGVDNWDWYGESLKGYWGEDEDED